MTESEPVFRRLWPEPDPRPLSGDDEILDAYSTPRDQPMLRLNFVSSVDGAVTLEGRSAPLAGAGDRKVLGLLRVACDAVMVGAGTVRNEHYRPLRMSEERRRMRLERGFAPDPVLVLVTRRLLFDPADPLLAESAQRPVILTTEETAAQAGGRFAEVADVLGLGRGEVDLPAAVAALTERGLRHVLSEGGPHLLGSLLAVDLVDEFCLTVGPKLVGPGPSRIVAGPPTDVRALSLSHVLAAGDELFLRYVRGKEGSLVNA